MITLIDNTTWMENAACTKLNLRTATRIFFPDSDTPDAYAQAIRICATCPVRARCLDYALTTETKTRFGVYGGLTPKNRAPKIKTDQQATTLKPAYCTECCSLAAPITNEGSTPIPATINGRCIACITRAWATNPHNRERAPIVFTEGMRCEICQRPMTRYRSKGQKRKQGFVLVGARGLCGRCRTAARNVAAQQATEEKAA